MSEKHWILNRKCFAALRAIGPSAKSCWRYIHCGPKGVTATDMVALIRVTLPAEQLGGNPEPEIFEYDQAMKLIPKGDKVVTMPEGLPAKTTGKYTVPNHDTTIPDPKDQAFTITVNAARLIDILKAAIEVSDHSQSLVRLRFYEDYIRIDAHRDAGGQEFMALVMGTDYAGNGIPGDAPVGSVTKPASEKCEEKNLVLPIYEGRVFRQE
jgi:hypothetical protein